MTFINWIKARSRRENHVKAQVDETTARHDAANPYPVIDPGIAAQEVDTMLLANAEMLTRIKLAYGCDRPTFERFILTPIRRHAAYINLLPATGANYFNEPGGLFRMSLEIAFFALQATDSQIFEGRATITSRRHLEPRWRLATFIAGLCGEIHHTLSQVVVRDAKGEEWHSYRIGLSPWLATRDAKRFFLRWKPDVQEVRAAGVFVLPQIIDEETLEYLASDNSVVVPHMMASISGMATYREHNILDDLVRRSTATVIDQNLQANHDRHGKSTLGAHLERYLVDAMRRLVASNPAWQPNSHQARLWYARDGLYVIWPGAMNDVISLLENEHLPGIPRSPDTILDVLIDAGVVQVHSTSRATWQIHPPTGAPLEALKLTSPAIVLACMVPSPEPLDLYLKAERAGTARANTGALNASAATDIERTSAPSTQKSGTAPPHTPTTGSRQRPPAAPHNPPSSDLRPVHNNAARPAVPPPACAADHQHPNPSRHNERGTGNGALVTLDELDQPTFHSKDRSQARQGSLDGFSGCESDAAPEELVEASSSAYLNGTADPQRDAPPEIADDGNVGTDHDADPYDGFPVLALRAAMGLPAMIEQPLAALIGEMNNAGPAPCRTVPSGLFIPLKELGKRKLDTAMLLRALDGVGMLVSRPGAESKTQMHDFNGSRVHGIVINAAFVQGLDPNDFTAPGPEEEDDDACT